MFSAKARPGRTKYTGTARRADSAMRCRSKAYRTVHFRHHRIFAYAVFSRVTLSVVGSLCTSERRLPYVLLWSCARLLFVRVLSRVVATVYPLSGPAFVWARVPFSPTRSCGGHRRVCAKSRNIVVCYYLHVPSRDV